MKKLITLALILCIGMLYSNVYGQQTQTQKNDKKGGFAVGGYDQAKPSKVTKRGVDIPEEAGPVKEAEEAPKPLTQSEPVIGPVEAREPTEGTEAGKLRSQAAKEKQKTKKDPGSKDKRR